MNLYTPRTIPWRPVKAYESIEPYEPPCNAETSQTRSACYIPDGMTTSPVKFPSLVVGYARNPIHVARVALTTRYPGENWYKFQKSLEEEAKTSLCAAQDVRQCLENISKEEKKRRDNLNFPKDTKNILRRNLDAKKLKDEVDELNKLLDLLVEENNKAQDFERRLKTFIKNIEAPIQISQECLHFRETRYKDYKVNDFVEQLIMEEIDAFQKCRKELKENVEICKQQILLGRKVQGEIENFIKTINWAIIVERQEAEIKKLAESKSRENDAKCLKQKASETMDELKSFLKRVKVEIGEKAHIILKTWNKTNEAFKKRRREMKEAETTNKKNLFKINTEIRIVQKNLEFLEPNKELCEVLLQGQEHLESLIRTRDHLEADLSSKLNSLFIDEFKCMSMRRSFPILMVTTP